MSEHDDKSGDDVIKDTGVENPSEPEIQIVSVSKSIITGCLKLFQRFH